MKIAVITDLHLDSFRGDRRYWDYFKKFYDNVFFPYLDQHQIREVFILGDIIDNRKTIDFNVLKIIKTEFFSKLSSYSTNIILGNHDVYYKTTNSVNSLELLCNEYQNITIHKSPSRISLGGTSFLMVPWINTENYDESMRLITSSQNDVVCSHLEIQGAKMTRNRYSDKGIDPSVFKNCKTVWSGHFHCRSTIANIQYIGNPYQLHWGDCGDTRGFSVFDTNTQELEFIKNPYQLFHNIFYQEDFVENLEECKEKFIKVFIKNRIDMTKYNRFMENLYSHGPYDVKVIEDQSQFDQEVSVSDAQAKSTLTIFNEYIDSTEYKINKTIIKKELKNLYETASLLMLEK